MPVFLTSDPRSGGGYASDTGKSVLYIDSGQILQLWKYGSGSTDWCTAQTGYTTPVLTDPRSAGLAAPLATTVMFVDTNVGTRLRKYGSGDTDWAEIPSPSGAVFTSGLNGLAPASGGGTSNFLRADGTWAAPSGGGGGGDEGFSFFMAG